MRYAHLKSKDLFGGLGVDARMILKWKSENYAVRLWIGVNSLRTWSSGRFL
jgi:hypothetical protein